MSGNYLGLFGSGLATFLSPCVLPLIPVFIASFASDFSSRRGRIKSALMFSLGFTIMFVLLGLSIGTISNKIVVLKPTLLLLGSILLTIFGLQKIGFFKEYKFFRGVGEKVNINKAASYFPKFLAPLIFGLIFGASWTPCVGPILGAVLTFLISKEVSILSGGLMLFVFSLGISLPLILFAIFFEKLNFIFVKLKKWSGKFEQAVGYGLIIFAVLMFKEVSIQSYFVEKMHEENAQIAVVDENKKTILIPSNENKIQMVFFHTSSCPVCHAMESYLPEFANKCNSNKFSFAKVNVDYFENSKASDQFKISSVPTISIFSTEGKEILRFVGYQTERKLKEIVETFTGSKCESV